MLGGSILDGVTRDSIITLAKDRHMPVTEKRISCEELKTLFESGQKVEAFGTGPAAVVAPIQSITLNDKEYSCYTAPDAVMYSFLKELQEIRSGKLEDIHGWNERIHQSDSIR
jgi:branched-chain amino acid aminotransferase